MSYSSKFFVSADALINVYNQGSNAQRIALVSPLIKSLVSTASQVGAELDYYYDKVQELEKRLKDIEAEKYKKHIQKEAEKYKKHIQNMKDYED